MKKGKGKRKGSSLESEDEELRLFLLNPQNPSKKGGSSQLKDKVSTVSEE